MSDFPVTATSVSQMPSQYRTYRPSGSGAVVLLIASIFAVFGGALGVYFGLTRPEVRQPGGMLLVAFAAAFFLMGCYLVAELVKSRIVLTPETIEICRFMSTRTLQRSQLRGWQMLPTSPPALVLVPRDTKQQKVKIAVIYRFDELLDAWLEPLPNLDVEESSRIADEIKANPELGFTEAERLEKLGSALRISRVLNISAGAFTLWAWIYPEPYKALILVLLVLPFLSLAAIRKFPGLMRIDHQRNDPRPSVGISFMFPGFALLLRGISDVHLFTWGHTIEASLAVAFVVWIAAFFADISVRTRTVNAVLVYLILVPYGFGSVIELNSLLDHSAPTIYSARVLSKRISGGKHTEYRLYLGSWELKQAGGWESVSLRLFRDVRRGDLVCLPVRPGAFQTPWYVVTTCH